MVQNHREIYDWLNSLIFTPSELWNENSCNSNGLNTLPDSIYIGSRKTKREREKKTRQSVRVIRMHINHF